MASFSYLIWAGVAVFSSFCLSVSPSSDGNKLDELEGSRDIVLMELLRRVKLLEARGNLVEAVEQNQQAQFESLHNLISRQQEWICRTSGGEAEHRCSMSKNVTNDEKVTSLPSHVAFMAYLDHDINGTKPGTIVFNKVILNEGDAYNNITGIFTAPRTGVYDFFFTIGQRDVKHVQVKLFVNNVYMVSAAVDTKHLSQDSQGSNRLLVRLQKGDAVFLKHNGGNIEGSEDLRLTTFSGLFLFE